MEEEGWEEVSAESSTSRETRQLPTALEIQGEQGNAPPPTGVRWGAQNTTTYAILA